MTPPTEEYRTIPLTQGRVAIVDVADYEWLSQWKWRCLFRGGGYAIRICRKSGKQRLVYMHREIMALPFRDKRQVDHINHDPLDNRRSNLRAVSCAVNQLNSRIRKDNTLGIKGISISGNGYCARIKVSGKMLHIGSYADAASAGAAYEKVNARLIAEALEQEREG